jgi:hypothetical protein
VLRARLDLAARAGDPDVARRGVARTRAPTGTVTSKRVSPDRPPPERRPTLTSDGEASSRKALRSLVARMRTWSRFQPVTMMSPL